MKRIVLLLLAAICMATVSAQVVTQKGVVYKYNGQNAKTPLGGVYIKAATTNNGVVSGEDGTFTLMLNNVKKGSRIGKVHVKKQGMIVFNQQTVDEWVVGDKPLCLIMCDSVEFQKQKDNLTAIGRNEAKKMYDKKLEELNRQKKAQQLQLDEYYNKLDSLDKNYQNTLRHMEEWVNVFASIDESELDSLSQKALDMFKRGEAEEAFRLLEQHLYTDRTFKADSSIRELKKY